MLLKKQCKLSVLKLSDYEKLEDLEFMPTVCLIALSKFPKVSDFRKVVRKCLSVGTLAFATYGNSADIVEQEIDSILEQEGGDLLSIPTASCQDEAEQDVAFFVINSLYLEKSNYRCLFVFDNSIADFELLLYELERFCASKSS